jgi:anti-anti-sigma factor
VHDEIVVHRDDPRVMVMELVGEHDGFSARKIGATIDAALAESRPVVVDVRRAQFLDSTVVSHLLLAQRTAAESGIGFAIVLDSSAGWPVRTIFEVTGLLDVLPVEPTLEAAFARLGTAAPERRSPSARRAGVDRRRNFAARPVAERRVAERRSGGDRRDHSGR